jgi:L-ascorbate metabolism protein UlaG (beta-lactamase superfamily)
MFEIEYKGANCVVISTKKTKLITDPKLSVVGIKDASTTESIELATEERFAVNNPDSLLVIDSPGEYGIGCFHVAGFPARRHLDTEKEPMISTVYRVEVYDSRIGIIGNIYEELSDEQLEELGVVDILIIPVGGNGYTLDAKGAADLARQIDPRIVIPIHYSDEKLKYEVPQQKLQLFIDELNVPVEKMPKYKSKQSNNLGSGSMVVVELIRS